MRGFWGGPLACQEVVDGGQVAEGVDGPKSPHLVEDLDLLRVLCALPVDVDGECQVPIGHAVVELGYLCPKKLGYLCPNVRHSRANAGTLWWGECTWSPGHAHGIDSTGTTFCIMCGMARNAVWLESLPGLP